jgi:peptidoglycan hydrolase-like protein with peptidoglycan-binding domain
MTDVAGIGEDAVQGSVAEEKPGTEEEPGAEGGAGTDGARRQRRWAWWIGGLVVVALIAAGFMIARSGGSASADGTSGTVDALPTATVDQGTLTASADRDGTVTNADSTTLTSDVTGRVTWLPRTGRVIEQGRTLARIDEQPIVAMVGAVPAFRTMAIGTQGRDVKQLETNLDELGYSGFTVDTTYTSATAEAVRSWQSDARLPVTGVVSLGQVKFLPGPVQVGAAAAAVGDAVQPGADLYAISSEGRVVQVSLDEADRDLAVVKAPVTIDAGAAGVATGTVTAVEAVTAAASSGQTSGSSTTTYVVTIEADTGRKGSDAAEGAKAVQAQADGSPVSVSFAEQEAQDVLSVPIKALLALAEGGYGLELVDSDHSSTVVAVETGLFANGRVEVSGAGVTEGATVRTAP